MSFFNAFIAPSRTGDAWFFAGLTTSYPDITALSSTSLSERLPCKGSFAPGCKVFHVPSNDSSQAVEVALDDTLAVSPDLKDQVIVFRFQGRFHAVDHRCPHSSYPLSRGMPFDIEDFGIRLSTGIRCPKHDWSFDLTRGNGDRGNYRLKIWEVQLRPVVAEKGEYESRDKEIGEDQEVWVRRKQRMG